MFSGHSIVVTLGNLIVQEYASPHWKYFFFAPYLPFSYPFCWLLVATALSHIFKRSLHHSVGVEYLRNVFHSRRSWTLHNWCHHRLLHHPSSLYSLPRHSQVRSRPWRLFVDFRFSLQLSSLSCFECCLFLTSKWVHLDLRFLFTCILKKNLDTSKMNMKRPLRLCGEVFTDGRRRSLASSHCIYFLFPRRLSLSSPFPRCPPS